MASAIGKKAQKVQDAKKAKEADNRIIGSFKFWEKVRRNKPDDQPDNPPKLDGRWCPSVLLAYTQPIILKRILLN